MKTAYDLLKNRGFQAADRILGRLISINGDQIPGFEDITEPVYNAYYDKVRAMIREEIGDIVR